MAKKGNDVIENPEVLAEKLEQSQEFIQKNKNLITYILGGLAIGAGLVFYYFYDKSQKNAEAQSKMYAAEYFFEQDSLDQALEGKAPYQGFMDIIEEYSGTDAANLAYYYAGVIYLKKGEFQKAVEHLSEFSASDYLVQSRAYCLLGDAYMELKDYNNAAKYYDKAANNNPDKQFTPKYLLKLAMALEMKEDYKGAVEAYDKIINKYFNAHTEVAEAKKYKGRAETLAAK